jgi:transcriptional regulator with XRE-family HTH domain
MSEDKRRDDLRRFLRERRARITPEEAGLPAGSRRRVPGLRREEVATIAGIGISWYTSLENGDARNVSATTGTAVADALRLDESERQHLMALVGLPRAPGRPAAPETLVLPTVDAIAFPAYLINSMWQVTACNAAFRWIWRVQDDVPFNAVERLFLDERARPMHEDRFEKNIGPVIAMLQASIGHYPDAKPLLALRDHVIADPRLHQIWGAHEITSPLLPSACTIMSPAGEFTYETLTLLVSNSVGLVVQVPDESSRDRLQKAPRGRLNRSTLLRTSNLT